MEQGKAVSLSFLSLGILVTFLARELATALWEAAHFPMPREWIVSPSDMIGIGIGVITFVVLIRNTKASTFVGEVIVELGKVVWPDRRETVLSTGVVSVLVGICALLLFGFDMLWGTLVNVFYR